MSEPPRRFPLVPFDPARFAPFFGDQVQQLTTTLLSGGASNSNYLGRLPDGTKFVCRFHSRSDGPAEKHITSLLHDLVPAPEYLWSGDGVSVLTYVEGTEFQPTPDLVRQAGRIIGRLAHINLERSGQILADGRIVPFAGWPTFYEGLLMMMQNPAVRAHLPATALDGVHALVSRTRHLWEDFDRSHNLVHGDFNPCNILIRDGSIVCVLDWEFAHSGCSYMDMGNLLRNLGPAWAADLAIGQRDEGFALPADWQAHAALMDLTSHLEFLTSQHSEEFKRRCVGRIEGLLGSGL